MSGKLSSTLQALNRPLVNKSLPIKFQSSDISLSLVWYICGPVSNMKSSCAHDLANPPILSVFS